MFYLLDSPTTQGLLVRVFLWFSSVTYIPNTPSSLTFTGLWDNKLVILGTYSHLLYCLKHVALKFLSKDFKLDEFNG